MPAEAPGAGPGGGAAPPMLRNSRSAPSLTADQGLGSTAKLIPSCYRSHRSIAKLVNTEHGADRLFEKRSPEELHDNILQWYPLDMRPKWVSMRAYQRKQMRPWNERGKLPGGGLGRSLCTPTNLPLSAQQEELKENICRQVVAPAAGSKVGSGGFPNSFDYSAGKTLDDFFYSRPKQAGSLAAISSFGVSAGRFR